MSPLRPPRLETGARLAVVSPSFPSLSFIEERRERAERALEARNLRLTYGPTAFECWGHLAGPPELRARDINRAFADDSVDGILCALGGGNSIDLLELLDYDLIRSNPKPFIGHSDNVVLMMAMLARTGMTTFHGPSLVNQMGEYPEPFPETLAGFEAALSRAAPLDLRPHESRTDVLSAWWFSNEDRTPRERNVRGGWRWLRPGRAEGPLLGGTLSAVLGLVSTPWCPRFDGAILFWDQPDANPAVVDAFLGQLGAEGILSSVAGMVVGCPTRMWSPLYLATLEDVVKKWAPLCPGPVLVDADCGHTDPCWTLPYGAETLIDSERDLFRTEAGVR